MNAFSQAALLLGQLELSYNDYNRARSAGTLTNVTWAPTLRSELLQQLKK